MLVDLHKPIRAQQIQEHIVHQALLTLLVYFVQSPFGVQVLLLKKHFALPTSDGTVQLELHGQRELDVQLATTVVEGLWIRRFALLPQGGIVLRHQ